jgi:hypothetical protein
MTAEWGLSGCFKWTQPHTAVAVYPFQTVTTNYREVINPDVTRRLKLSDQRPLLSFRVSGRVDSDERPVTRNNQAYFAG